MIPGVLEEPERLPVTVRRTSGESTGSSTGSSAPSSAASPLSALASPSAPTSPGLEPGERDRSPVFSRRRTSGSSGTPPAASPSAKSNGGNKAGKPAKKTSTSAERVETPGAGEAAALVLTEAINKTVADVTVIVGDPAETMTSPAGSPVRSEGTDDEEADTVSLPYVLVKMIIKWT